MKSKLYLLLWGILFTFITKGQDFNLSAAYQYTYSSAWDNAIQRYNFARPFMDKTQPLLIHGSYLEASYFFASNTNFNSGIKASYSFTRSSSDNLDKVSVHLNQLHLGYSIRYSPNGKLKNLSVEADLSVIYSILSRRVNNEIELIDEEKNRAYGIGINLGLAASYKIEIKNQRFISPFIGIGYSPYLNSPESESVLDPSISIYGTQNIQLLNGRIGIRYIFLKSN